MFELRQEGKILHLGVSNVSPEELETAMSMGPIATVENMYGHGQRNSLKLVHGGETMGGAEVQINLAWLLHRSPWMLPIPGTSSLQHFEENLKAADIALTELVSYRC